MAGFFNRFKYKRDIVIATLVFAISALVSAWAYAAMIAMEGTGQVFMSSIEEGTTQFHIVNKGACIGNLSTILLLGDNSGLRSVGKVRGVYGQKTHEASAELTAQFNPLGQLTESSSRISAPDIEIVVRSKSIAPIRLIVQATIRGQTYSYDFEVPGPVLLKKIRGDRFQVQYFGLRQHQGGILQTISDNLFGDLDLHVVEASTSTVSCAPDAMSAFDIAGLLLKSRAIELFIQRFAPHTIP